MRKPVLQGPNCVIDVEPNRTDSKHFWLKLITDNSITESIIVILNN